MIVRGSGRMKLDDEIVDVKEWDVVRVPPGVWRGYEAGPDGLEILVFGAPSLGDDLREDVEGQRDWWADCTPWDGGGRGGRSPERGYPPGRCLTRRWSRARTPSSSGCGRSPTSSSRSRATAG